MLPPTKYKIPLAGKDPETYYVMSACVLSLVKITSDNGVFGVNDTIALPDSDPYFLVDVRIGYEIGDGKICNSWLYVTDGVGYWPVVVWTLPGLSYRAEPERHSTLSHVFYKPLDMKLWPMEIPIIQAAIKEFVDGF